MNRTVKTWVVFALAVTVCHNWWPILHPLHTLTKGTRIGQYVDLTTPFAILLTAIWALMTNGANRKLQILFVISAILYVEGHGIHLSANDINNKHPLGDAAISAHYWDEVFGHAYWFTGWVGVMTAVVASGRSTPGLTWWRVLLGLVLGFVWMTNFVEAGLVPMAFVVNALAAVACLKWRDGLSKDALIMVGFSTVLLVIFGIWQGGFPQFSELGWL